MAIGIGIKTLTSHKHTPNKIIRAKRFKSSWVINILSSPCCVYYSTVIESDCMFPPLGYWIFTHYLVKHRTEITKYKQFLYTYLEKNPCFLLIINITGCLKFAHCLRAVNGINVISIHITQLGIKHVCITFSSIKKIILE